MTAPRALVVGTGIAGLAAAMRLREIGWEPLLVERAPGRRPAGYFVGLFETGRATAQRMGVLDAIGNRIDPEGVTYDVDRSGTRRRPSMGYGDLPGEPRLIMRGDIEAALHAQIGEDVEIRYGTTPVAVDEHPDGVDVTLSTATGDHETRTTERFDLVVGADGLRSTVRRLVFGPDSELLRPLNHIIAATLLKEQVPGFRTGDGLTLAEEGRAAWVFPFADHAPGLLLTYRTDDEDAQFRRPPLESLRAAFGPEPAGPVLENLLGQFADVDDTLFDSVHQVDMPTWHSDRVVLVGDSAWCLTLYSGMGASLGLAGADLLGTTLARNPGNPARALREWEQRLRPFVAVQQKSGRTDGLAMFVPQNRRDLALRGVMSTMTSNRLTNKAMRSFIASRFREKSVDVAAP
ncbi:2-polyprenyl-6-methoxyphenol hydroxylase-like FAD-dependent oxidoreductase [Isoptericola jiangsuensis]|uniref:2-polyprenyl-6-methoxyphenol hydroxylase-like FAD-dependent oxidoreductase n=1 Tax=Isoptericola jiangsuensis TaxID=548579 RepID=A0A2A9ER64_9MICO|nr:FAD-dependent monooxygenase [Isoptericola jiangsuensis]PFG41484.1 2-polyprenyl-6-methoxyphenol hydroxylase-like FAD-dependent oxidoreductase [Isoptericola jiangsuensis]